MAHDPDLQARPPTATEPARPDVIVEVLFERGLLFIGVRNIGSRPALDVSVRFDAPLPGLGGERDVARQSLFRDLRFLGPGREIVTLLDSSASWFARRQPTQITAAVEYADADARRYSATIRHDLSIYRDIVFVQALQATTLVDGTT